MPDMPTPAPVAPPAAPRPPLARGPVKITPRAQPPVDAKKKGGVGKTIATVILILIILGAIGTAIFMVVKGRPSKAPEAASDADTTQGSEEGTLAPAAENVPAKRMPENQPFWLAHLTFDTTERQVEENGPKTWLYDKEIGLTPKPDDCVEIKDFVDPEVQRRNGVTSAALNDGDVLQLFNLRLQGGNIDGSQGTPSQNLISVMDGLGLDLRFLCENGDDDYAVLFRGDYSSQAQIAKFNPVNKYWDLYQPIPNILDGVFRFHSQVFEDGSPLIATGYGDAGVINWKYWLLTENKTTQLIESCTSAYQFETDTTNLNCEIEYLE